eukprot:scaffold28581_cov14-Tisochrysis_lutea.AAC.1
MKEKAKATPAMRPLVSRKCSLTSKRARASQSLKGFKDAEGKSLISCLPAYPFRLQASAARDN